MNATKTVRLALAALLAACLPVMAAISPAYAEPLQAETDFSAVDAYIEAQRKALNIPGLALAIVQGDQVAYLHGYGQAGPDGRPVTSQTPFMIGSTTKSITALAIMQLVEAGKIELDAPLQTYLPWFRTAGPFASATLTVRHLLSHTSGLSLAVSLEEFTASDLSGQAIENTVRRLSGVEIVHAPGSVYEYNNANYTILGLVVQIVSGQSYESYVQEHIFDPLEMHHSFASQADAIKDGMATGYVTWFGIPFPKNVPFNRGNLSGGYLICSVEDLAHHLIAQLNDGRYGNVSVLSPEGVAELHRPAIAIGNTGLSYALSWAVGPFDGTPVIYHTGDNANFAALLLMVPQEKLAIAILSNVNGESVWKANEQIGAGVLAILKGNQPKTYQLTQMFYQTVGSTVVPVALSLLWVAWTVFRYLRGRRHGLPVPAGLRWVVWVIGLPLLVDLGLLWVLLGGIPKLWSLPLSGIWSLFPDMFTLLMTAALCLAVWGTVRTVLNLKRRNSLKGWPAA